MVCCHTAATAIVAAAATAVPAPVAIIEFLDCAAAFELAVFCCITFCIFALSDANLLLMDKELFSPPL